MFYCDTHFFSAVFLLLIHGLFIPIACKFHCSKCLEFRLYHVSFYYFISNNMTVTLFAVTPVTLVLLIKLSHGDVIVATNESRRGAED